MFRMCLLYLRWYHDSSATIPDNLLINHSRDKETVLLSQRLEETSKAENHWPGTADQLIMQAARQLSPQVLSLWIRLKGGRVVGGRILKSVKVNFCEPSPRAYAFIMLVMTQFLVIHLVYRNHEIEIRGFGTNDKPPSFQAYIERKFDVPGINTKTGASMETDLVLRRGCTIWLRGGETVNESNL